jgi:hypothetical protein
MKWGHVGADERKTAVLSLDVYSLGKLRKVRVVVRARN